MKRTFALAAFAALIAAPAFANPLWWSADRVEDRLDRRESVIDRRVDRGPLDMAEDRLDAIESRLDRRDIVLVPRPHWHERRTIRARVIN